ncbi:MAG: chromate transporter, partial [Pseudomonadota bacterium]
AGTAFVAIWVFGVPFPAVIAAAAVAGVLLKTAEPRGEAPAADFDLRGLAIIVGTGLGLILAVWLLVRASFGAEPFDGVATLFTSAAFVSFGGAYALLPYVADRAVETYGWLSATQMLNGLAIAEATPGPLILVNTYAGFFAGWGVGSGVLTASLATFYTFAPSFMLILAVAPYVTAVEGQPVLRRALAGVSTAVVGVILNLAVYLGVAALMPAGPDSLAWPKLVLLAGFAALTLWRNPPMHVLVGLGALAGLGLWALSVI